MGVKRFKLYHYPATRSTRVKWLLHEMFGDDFDVERVSLYEGKQYAPEYLTMNPNHNVPMLELQMEDGSVTRMLESGAMLAMLADAYPEKGLAPPPSEATPERALYLHMLHFATSWMDMMLWQVRCQTHLIHESERDARTLERYRKKLTREVEPQLQRRLSEGAYIAGDRFTAADCAMGQNVMWARAYGLCDSDEVKQYVGRLRERPAFQAAYADVGDFTLAPPSAPQGIPGFPG